MKYHFLNSFFILTVVFTLASPGFSNGKKLTITYEKKTLVFSSLFFSIFGYSYWKLSLQASLSRKIPSADEPYIQPTKNFQSIEQLSMQPGKDLARDFKCSCSADEPYIQPTKNFQSIEQLLMQPGRDLARDFKCSCVEKHQSEDFLLFINYFKNLFFLSKLVYLIGLENPTKNEINEIEKTLKDWDMFLKSKKDDACCQPIFSIFIFLKAQAQLDFSQRKKIFIPEELDITDPTMEPIYFFEKAYISRLYTIEYAEFKKNMTPIFEEFFKKDQNEKRISDFVKQTKSLLEKHGIKSQGKIDSMIESIEKYCEILQKPSEELKKETIRKILNLRILESSSEVLLFRRFIHESFEFDEKCFFAELPDKEVNDFLSKFKNKKISFEEKKNQIFDFLFDKVKTKIKQTIKNSLFERNMIDWFLEEYSEDIAKNP